MTQDSFEEELRELLAAGNKMQAIKRYREENDSGLAEAKEAVEVLAAGGNVADSSSSTKVTVDDPELIDEVKDLIGQGNPLLAVKLVRERTGRGLKESKELVDQIGVESGLTTPSGSGCLGAVLFATAIPLAGAWAVLA